MMSGEGEQTVHDREPVQVRPGACIHISPDVPHSAVNAGWEPMRLVVYAPSGAERDMNELRDCDVFPPAKCPNDVGRR